jgi:hypothetical protein
MAPQSCTLLVGDAKRSDEPPTRAASRKRLENYAREARTLIEAGKVRAACFAVATDDPRVARMWAAAAERITERNGWARSRLRVRQVDRETWVAYGCPCDR